MNFDVIKMHGTTIQKIHQTIQRQNPKDITLHENHRDLRSQKVQFVSQ